MNRDDLPTVIFDLDSTLADTRHRREYLPVGAQRPSDWIGYHTHCLGDDPVYGPISLMRLLHPHHRIVILTARPDDADIRGKTNTWLDAHKVPHDDLILLPLQETRSSGDWKSSVLYDLRNREAANVVLFVDDWGPTGRAVEANGVPFLHVARPGTDVLATAGI
jgi:hypothetical protein